MAIIATPTDDAQLVADILIGAGIKGILNLTSTLVTAPNDVCVRNVDVVAELFALSYYCGLAHGEGEGRKELFRDTPFRNGHPWR